MVVRSSFFSLFTGLIANAGKQVDVGFDLIAFAAGKFATPGQLTHNQSKLPRAGPITADRLDGISITGNGELCNN